MANRYWVGGAGNWSSTTKWSTSSGGASGASVPIATDDAIFDANSGGKFTATVDTAQSVNSITITPSAVVGFQVIALSARLTTNNLTTTGTAGNNRIWFRGTTFGIAQDFVINGTVSISDCDFRDIYVIGTAAPISGTRIGDLRGIRGITADTPKTVYWNLAGAQNWSADGWAATSTGTPSTDNFPLAQDTATFTNAGSVTGTITMNAAIPYTGTVDMSGRTSAMTLATTAFTIYGNWINGSGTTLSGTAALTYSGRNTQTITSAGKTFTQALTVDSYGGSVELVDALNIGATTLTVTNGTFDTKNFNVTAGEFSSNNSNVRTINLGSSTVTLSASNVITFSTATNLTFNAGTSQINCTANGAINFNGGGVTFYNVSCTTAQSSASTITFNQVNIFNNLTFTAPSGSVLQSVAMSANQTITGTLTVAGATVIRRIFLRSSTVGTQRKLTVGTLVADDCDFIDIEIAGAAAGSSPTRAGDCGGNTGITFPSPKTVYWNLAGTQNWSATAWAPGTGGTPAFNNFPLAQDTAVFDNAGAAGTVTIDATWNIGTFNASARTSAMTLTTSTNLPVFYGNWIFGTGVTSSSTTGTITFSGRSTSTITSNGITFNCPITVACITGTVQLADALSLGATRTLTHTSGTFDAVTYNITVGLYSAGSAIASSVIKMGSGTWTISGTGTVWGLSSAVAFYKGTANIVLSDTSTTARTFSGGNNSYNKLTIGGATGISTLTISGNNQFTELASTKTVAHTIALGSTVQTFGAWTVSGTVGNVVTATGTGTTHNIVGARVSGIDYLAMGTISFANTSPGEFYSGANSTGTGANIIKTAAPAATTRYWVGGTGTWDATTTTNWSVSSGGLGGASVPTSADAVVFDTLSNATAYTVTCTATQLRCAALTMAGPAIGDVTWAGTAPLAIHGDVSLAATGITRTYTGAITLTGSATGKTLITNGVTLASAVTVNGVSCGWSLSSALNIGTSVVTVTNGSFDLATYNLTTDSVSSDNANTRTINFGTGTTTLDGTSPINFGTTETSRANLTVTASTSQLNITRSNPTLTGNNQTFYNVSFTSVLTGSPTINGINSFNDLSVTGPTSTGLKNIILSADQTITGTLTFSAGTDARMRHFVRSDVIGTTRTLTCGAFSGTDVDFKDITIAGAAAPVSGTRLANCGGNTGITYSSPKTVYWNLGGPQSFFSIAWASSSGGTPNANNIPLAQDTAVFDDAGAVTGSIGMGVINVGTIDTSARTISMSFLNQTGSNPNIYGNWISGTGLGIGSGAGTISFSGHSTQTITSNGCTFGCNLAINCFSTVQLADALICSRDLSLTNGTFDAVSYNVTAGRFVSNGSNVRTVKMGSGTWTLTDRFDMWIVSNSLTFFKDTANIVISFTSAFGRTFTGAGFSYNKLTIGGVTGTSALGFADSNKFTELASTRTVAYAISLGTTTQTVDAWTIAGTAGNAVTVQGTSASSPATLILTGGTVTTPDYLTITGVRAYNLSNTWYAGANSTNNGSLGWIFEAGPTPPAPVGNNSMFLLF